MSLAILAATANQLPLIRTITQLPLFPGQVNMTAYLAVLTDDDHERQLVGAGVICQLADQATLWITVLESWRRQGIGRQLLQRIVNGADSQLVKKIIVWQPVTETAGWAFCERHRWHRQDTLTHYATTMSDAVQFLDRYFQRFQQRRSIPEDLRVVFDAEIPWSWFLPLLAREFGPSLSARVQRIIQFGLHSHEWASALILEHQPVAISLCTIQNDAVMHDIYAVAPEFRQGWAHIAGKYFAARDLLAQYPSIQRYCFSTGNAHTDTRKAALSGAARGYFLQMSHQARVYDFKLDTVHG